MTLDDNASERPTIKSEPITQQAEYLEDDVINRTASLSADDAGNGNGDIEFRSVSPAVEVEGNPGRLSAVRVDAPKVDADLALRRACVVR